MDSSWRLQIFMLIWFLAANTHFDRPSLFLVIRSITAGVASSGTSTFADSPYHHPAHQSCGNVGCLFVGPGNRIIQGADDGFEVGGKNSVFTTIKTSLQAWAVFSIFLSVKVRVTLVPSS